MKYLLLFISITLIACTDPVEQCVQQKQESWRKSNPNADYGKSSSANEKFRKECGNYKK
jgi:hypothetical protein